MKTIFYSGICMLFLAVSLYGQNKLLMEVANIPPHSSPQLPGNGMLAQILEESLKGKEWTIEYSYFPFARLMSMMDSGTVHGTFTGIIAIDKDKYYYKQLQINNVVFFYKKSKFPEGLSFNTISDLSNYRVGVVAGIPMEDILKKAGLIVDPATNETLDFRKLQADRIDLVSTVDVFGLYQIKKNGLNIRDFGMTLPYDISYTIIAINKSVPDAEKAIKDIEYGFRKAKKNGRLLNIIESYLGKGNVPHYMIP